MTAGMAIANVRMFILRLMAEDVSINDAARRALVRMPRACAMTMDVIGLWPSSDPALRALQRSWS
jgi:hypothetical protein